MNTGTTRIRRARTRYAETPIPPQALELIADVLLAASAQDESRPAYDEVQLARKVRQAYKAEAYFGMASSDANAPDEPFDDKDSDEELTLLQMYCRGMRVSQIARELDIAGQKVQRLVRNELLQADTREESPLMGLREVYREEIHRHVYHKPGHCASGPCRLLGYCKYAGA